MKKIIIFVLVALLLIPGIALASDVSDAKYSGIIVVSNNGTAASAVSVNMSLATDDLIAVGYLDADAENCAIQNTAGADVAFMPAPPSSDNWCIFVPAINANSYLSNVLYCGTVTGGAIRYFPGADGMTTPDDASLEPSDNFTMEWKGWFDAGATGNISAKAGAYYVDTDGMGGIKAEIPFFADEFTADAWTDVGTPDIYVDVGNERIAYTADRSAVDERCYIDITELSNTKWELYFTWHPTSRVAGGQLYFGLFSSNTNANGYAGDGIALYCGTDTDTVIRRWDGGAAASSGAITITHGNTYYVTLERTSATAVSLGIFSDGERTTHIAGSPVSLVIPATVADLQYIQASNYNDNAGAGEEQVGWITDVALFDNTSVEASGITSGEHTVTASLGDEENCLSFDGNDYVSVASNADIDLDTSDFTLAAWINADVGVATPQRIISKQAGAWYWLRLVGGRPYSDIKDAAANTATVTSAAMDLRDGAWHYLVVTCDRDNVAGYIMYVDGVASGAAVDPTLANGSLTNATPLNVGRFSGGSEYFVGDIGDIQVYEGRAWSAAEVLSAYNAGYPTDTTDLSLWWAMLTGSGTAAVDSSGNGYDGLITGATWANTIGRYSIYVDDVLEDTLITEGNGISIPDNANDIVDFTNYVMPYVEYVKRWVGGALVQWIEWEYDTVFTDLSGNGNDATPSFRIGTSDPDVSAALMSFGPVTEADAPAYSLSDPPDFITTTPGATGNFSTTVNITLPGWDVPKAVAIAGGVPEQLIAQLFAIFVLLVISFSYSAYARSVGHGSLFIKSTIVTVVMCILIAVRLMDVWQAYMFVILALGLTWMSRQREAY